MSKFSHYLRSVLEPGSTKSAGATSSSQSDSSRQTAPAPSVTAMPTSAAAPISSTATATTAPPSTSPSSPLLAAIEARRTFYGLTKTLPPNLTDKKIHQIVDHVVKHTPSSFNSQSTRLVVLSGEAHNKFWRIVHDGLEKIVPAERFGETAKKIAGFAAGYGTIVFYEDPTSVNELMEKFPTYAENFPVWSEHTSAMHQIFLWTALEAEGAGANLQHYSPIFDELAAKEWNIPAHWKARAQLVFGGRAENYTLPVKTFKPLEERVFYHTS